MAKSTSLSFDIDELVKLDSEVCDSYNGIQNMLNKIKGCLGNLQANVTGVQVNNLIATISGNITAINGKMDTSFEQLNEFLKGQMSNYTNTYEGALAVLNRALTFIDSNF